jgi:Tol biopolymer transport system component
MRGTANRGFPGARTGAPSPIVCGVAVLIVALLAFGCLMSPVPAVAKALARNGRIAFSQGPLFPNNGDLSEHSQVFTITPNGAGLRQLTHVASDRSAASPDWSPRGRLIVYESNGSGDFEIWVMRADGSHRTQLTHDPGFDHLQPSWSPNGTRIVFSRCGKPFGFPAFCDIVVMNADGTGMRQLTRGSWIDQRPEFSPSGKRIAFDSTHGGLQSAIWVIDARGRHLERLTRPALRAFWPGWSPDGRRIVFTDNCCIPFSNVWTMRADGTHKRQLTHFAGPRRQGAFASYSPNGKKVVLSYSLHCPNGPCRDFFTMNADGSRLHRVVTGQRDTLLTDWGPAP